MLAQDQELQDYLILPGLSQTANLFCGSTSRPFPSDANRIFWSKVDDITEKSETILYCNLPGLPATYFNGYSFSKHRCTSRRVLSITDVQIGDLGTYMCTSYGSAESFTFTVKLEILGEYLSKTVYNANISFTYSFWRHCLIIICMRVYEHSKVYIL